MTVMILIRKRRVLRTDRKIELHQGATQGEMKGRRRRILSYPFRIIYSPFSILHLTPAVRGNGAGREGASLEPAAAPVVRHDSFRLASNLWGLLGSVKRKLEGLKGWDESA